MRKKKRYLDQIIERLARGACCKSVRKGNIKETTSSSVLELSNKFICVFPGLFGEPYTKCKDPHPSMSLDG